MTLKEFNIAFDKALKECKEKHPEWFQTFPIQEEIDRLILKNLRNERNS